MTTKDNDSNNYLLICNCTFISVFIYVYVTV